MTLVVSAWDSRLRLVSRIAVMEMRSALRELGVLAADLGGDGLVTIDRTGERMSSRLMELEVRA